MRLVWKRETTVSDCTRPFGFSRFFPHQFPELNTPPPSLSRQGIDHIRFFIVYLFLRWPFNLQYMHAYACRTSSFVILQVVWNKGHSVKLRQGMLNCETLHSVKLWNTWNCRLNWPCQLSSEDYGILNQRIDRSMPQLRFHSVLFSWFASSPDGGTYPPRKLF